MPEIFSIFGEIDAAIANAMIREGKLVRIEPRLIPLTQLVDRLGRHARFAVVVPRKFLQEFNSRIEELRSLDTTDLSIRSRTR
jgi:hypothetical protein